MTPPTTESTAEPSSTPPKSPPPSEMSMLTRRMLPGEFAALETAPGDLIPLSALEAADAPTPVSPTPAPPPGDHRRVSDVPLDFTRLFYMLYISLDTQVSLATTKAQLIMGANAILLAAVSTNLTAAQRLLGNAAGGWDVAVLATTLLMLVVVFVSISTALGSARPNLAPPAAEKNLFFFDHIAQMDADEFTTRFMNQTMENIKHDIARQVHARSRVITAKYGSLRTSLNALFAALLLFALSRLLAAVAG